MIDHLNQSLGGNIITIEDPIEFVHPGKRCQVIQREVGTHVPSFADGLRAALREDPDIILVGELRDMETISMAMTAAETGHLVLGTLHTTSATKSIDRIIDALPAEQRAQAKGFLAQSLRGVITQVLIKTADGHGRRCLQEILVMNPAIAQLITNDKVFQIPAQLQTGRAQGMQLLDQVLMEAVQAKSIDPNEAFQHAKDKRSFAPFVTDHALLGETRGSGGPP
jgi:twitching motility protein PilT